MFDECGLELWPQMTNEVSTPINNFLYFFAYFICGVELPALWMIVTEAIYNLRESHNCPRTFDTYFILWYVYYRTGVGAERAAV